MESFQEEPTETGEEQLPAATRYDEDAPFRIWQAWIPAEQLAEDAPFALNIRYDEAVYHDSNGELSFTFYKQKASEGGHEVAINDEYRYLSSSSTVTLTVPANPES